MSKYLILSEVKSEAYDVEWWMDQTDSKYTVELKDKFETARKSMRNTICKLIAECDFFPADEGHFEAFDEYDYDEVEELDEIITGILTNPKYFFDNAEDLDIQDTDDGDGYFAFVGNPNLILVDYYGKKLKFNVHNMDDSDKDYFFEYTETDDNGSVISEISVRLLNTKRTNLGKNEKVNLIDPNYETISFGKYVQDSEGKEKTDIVWRILDKKDGKAFVISDEIIDHVQFFHEDKNDWNSSNIRNWLNKDFLHQAFTDEEISRIIEVNEDKISLLSYEEYNKYFDNPKEARARFTDYSRRLAEKNYSTKIREPYGFWWLSTPNNCGGWGEDEKVYVNHVCNNGTVNGFERASYKDGVRPTMWIKID